MLNLPCRRRQVSVLQTIVGTPWFSFYLYNFNIPQLRYKRLTLQLHIPTPKPQTHPYLKKNLGWINLLKHSGSFSVEFPASSSQGWYSETGFHIDMDRNFVGLWRRHNCRSQVIDLSLSALISWFMKSIIGFLNSSNLHAMISTLLIINLHWVKIFFCCIRRNL